MTAARSAARLDPGVWRAAVVVKAHNHAAVDIPTMPDDHACPMDTETTAVTDAVQSTPCSRSSGNSSPCALQCTARCALPTVTLPCPHYHQSNAAVRGGFFYSGTSEQACVPTYLIKHHARLGIHLQLQPPPLQLQLLQAVPFRRCREVILPVRRHLHRVRRNGSGRSRGS